VTGAELLDALSAVALLSDGASRLADVFRLATWTEMGDILAGEGPAGLIQRVRAAEAGDPHGERWPRGKIQTTRPPSTGKYRVVPKPPTFNLPYAGPWITRTFSRT
jgi:hypothetical protein